MYTKSRPVVLVMSPMIGRDQRLSRLGLQDAISPCTSVRRLEQTSDHTIPCSCRGPWCTACEIRAANRTMFATIRSKRFSGTYFSRFVRPSQGYGNPDRNTMGRARFGVFADSPNLVCDNVTNGKFTCQI